VPASETNEAISRRLVDVGIAIYHLTTGTLSNLVLINAPDVIWLLCEYHKMYLHRDGTM
jgi:hypothetical protein